MHTLGLYKCLVVLLLTILAGAASGQPDGGSCAKEPEPLTSTIEKVEPYDATEHDNLRKYVGGGEIYKWWESSWSSPDGWSDNVKASVKGATVVCSGNFCDGDSSRSSSIGGGGKGETKHYKHAAHGPEDQVWWKAEIKVSFRTHGSTRGLGKLSATGYCKAFGGEVDYHFSSTTSGNSVSRESRMSISKTKSSAGASIRVDGQAAQGTDGRSAGVDGEAAAHGALSNETEVTTVEQDEDETSGATTRSTVNKKSGKLRGFGDGCEFSALVEGMHHIEMSGKRVSNSNAVVQVHESSTRPGLPKVEFLIGQIPEEYHPWKDPNWTLQAPTPASVLEGAITDPADGTGFRLDLHPGFGLDGEHGIRHGEIEILIESPSADDITFALSQSGSGSMLLQEDSIVIVAGASCGSTQCTLESTETVTVTATRLDATGAPTAFALSEDLAGISTATREDPKVSISWPGSAFRTAADSSAGLVMRRAQVDVTPPPIHVRRSGFEEFATEATTVEVSVDDPLGILVALPSEVTIEAGDEVALVDIFFTGTEGRATVSFEYGDTSSEITIEAVGLGWQSSIPHVEVPANARMIMLDARLNVPTSAEMEVTFTSQNPAVIGIDTGWATRTLPEGWDSILVPLTAVSPGTTAITITCDELPAISVPVTVRPAEVELSSTTVTLSDTLGDNGGVYILRAPTGLNWATFTPPTGTSGFMSVTGVGTDTLTIRFEDGVVRGLATVVSSCHFEGILSGANTVVVFDGIHAPDHQVNYIYEVQVD